MRRAGIQLNGAQRRDLVLLPSLPFFTPQLPTGTGESILGDDLPRSKTRIKWPYIPGGTECLCFCPHHVGSLWPYGSAIFTERRSGARSSFLSFFFPVLSFAFCFLLFAFCFDFFNRHITGCKTTNGGARWQFVLFEYGQLDAPHVVTNRWPHGRRRLDIGRTSRNELNVESQRRD